MVSRQIVLQHSLVQQVVADAALVLPEEGHAMQQCLFAVDLDLGAPGIAWSTIRNPDVSVRLPFLSIYVMAYV